MSNGHVVLLHMGCVHGHSLPVAVQASLSWSTVLCSIGLGTAGIRSVATKEWPVVLTPLTPSTCSQLPEHSGRLYRSALTAFYGQHLQ